MIVEDNIQSELFQLEHEYVDIYFSKYINKYIYVISNTSMLPDFFLCKFLDFNHNTIVNRDYLLIKPENIFIETNNKDKLVIRNDQFASVISKDLLDLYTILMNNKNIPDDLSNHILDYIPNYGKLF
tara:strand:- start:161 stop:541 length:381 start_codon:yes stop_codon:yes gene_type:complete